jgi:hypothetical protein
MKEIIISLLKPFAQLCYKFATAVSVQTALVIYILVLAVLAVWVLSLKKEKSGEADDGKILFLHDLRFWAVLILLLQAVIYIIFR